MKEYSFVMPNHKRGTYNWFAILLALLFLSGFYFIANKTLLVILLALLSFFYYLSQRIRTIRIRRQNISYPALLQKKISWNELNNVVLKDGMLTLDFVNNHIFQVEIMETVNEKEFNDFCREQLKAVV